MPSPKKPELPIWTIQVACLTRSFCQLLLTGAIIYGKDIPQGTFLGFAALCTLDNGLMLGTPGRALQGIGVAITGWLRKDK